MNIRDRVLDDRGFSNTAEKPEKADVRVLKARIHTLEKKLKDKDKVYSEQAQIEHVKMVDKVAALEKEVRLLRRDNDKLKGREEQLMKEVADVAKVMTPKKSAAPKKTK